MSFESVLSVDMKKPGFGSKAYVLTFKDFLAVTRNNISREKVDRYGAALYNKPGEFHSTFYKDELAVRYIAQTDVADEIVMSIYEVSTMSLCAARFAAWNTDVESAFAKFMALFKDPKNRNFEVRVIGLQDNQKYGALYDILRFSASRKLPILEVDLFGGNIRHVALDAKTGMSYNMLLENRLYKPGELANKALVQAAASQQAPAAGAAHGAATTAQH